MRNLLFVRSAFLLFIPAALFADSSAETADAWLDRLHSLSGVAAVGVPGLDLEALFAEDQVREAAGLPFRFAMPHSVRMTPDRHGTWETLDDGARLWRLRIEAPGAASLNLGFDRYSMPPGGRLSLYSADGSLRLGPYTERDNAPHDALWTPALATDDLVVEVILPAAEEENLRLRLASINQGYRAFGAPLVEKSGSCNVDVVCPEGDAWDEQIRSVARVVVAGLYYCTGFLVNNTALDKTPYFMTADHCDVTPEDAASVVVSWNYENSTCRTPGGFDSGEPGDGSLAHTQTGAFYRAGYGLSDFALLELDEAPDPAFDVFFAGWDRSISNPLGAVGIHHPSGDEKRISFENDPVGTTSYGIDGGPGDGTHIRVASWDLGTTEGGSSGSPLFDLEGRVIGQLHGGRASCFIDDADWYGRFSTSWTGGGTSESRLSDWLDPLGTGAMALDGLDGRSIFVDGFERGSTDAWSSSMP